MSFASDEFKRAMGGPANPATEPGLTFTGPGGAIWDLGAQDFGAGWFKNRFIYMFGPGLEPLKECLDAWSFLVKPKDDRVILGRNAYGAICYVDNMNVGNPRVYILDPLEVQLIHERGMNFIGFLARFIPQGLVKRFTDSTVYEQFIAKSRLYLDLDHCLGIKTALSLGGAMEVDNFQVENIYSYYKTTGPIYAKAAKVQ